MTLKVLKSPSLVGHICGSKHNNYHSACRATVRYTPNARCVLQNCCTIPAPSPDKHTYNGATLIAPAFHDMPQTINQLVLSTDQAVAPEGTTCCTAKTIKSVKLKTANVIEKQGET